LHKTDTKERRKKIVLRPGEFCVTREDAVICTLLGSCVSVCLYDPIHHIIGMNHFLHSRMILEEEEADSCHPDPGRHGICAMDSLISGMLKQGAGEKNLRAKVFGGGSMFRPFQECTVSSCVGKANVVFVMNFLKKHRIQVAAADTGGNFGRVIRFSAGDYYVYVRKIRKQSTPEISAREQKYWNRLKNLQDSEPYWRQRMSSSKDISVIPIPVEGV
jgi:chemotaxis protein CheD